jgi:hypothetical protein
MHGVVFREFLLANTTFLFFPQKPLCTVKFVLVYYAFPASNTSIFFCWKSLIFYLRVLTQFSKMHIKITGIQIPNIFLSSSFEVILSG